MQTTYFIILTLLAVSPATAQADLRVREVIDRVTYEQGRGAQFAAVEEVFPGDRLRYQLHFRNEMELAADSVMLTTPVPPGLDFTGKTASSAPADFEVSVDHGVTYGTLETLFIQAATGPRPATLRDVTDLRWRFVNEVPAGAEGVVEFYAIVERIEPATRNDQ